MLSPTGLVGLITFLGINESHDDLSTSPRSEVQIDYTGITGEIHSGLTRKSCVRVKKQYPKGTEIRNTRQISALSDEELSQIRLTMKIDRLEPSWVGANMVLKGLPDFSKIPPSSRLIASNGTSLVIDMENAPCRYPGEIIDRHEPGTGRRFAKAAMNRRGVTLWVERPGTLFVGEKMQLHIPPVCHWRHATSGN